MAEGPNSSTQANAFEVRVSDPSETGKVTDAVAGKNTGTALDSRSTTSKETPH
jgi:hypothetical protein